MEAEHKNSFSESYANAGVDITAGYKAVELVAKQLKGEQIADVGIAGGRSEAILFKKGEVIRKVPEDQLLSVLREELLAWK